MPDPTPADFAAVETASERWMRAWVDQDLAELDRSLAPDFTLIIGNAPAAVMPRATWLAMVPRYRCTRFAYRDVQLRSLDEMVLMSAIAEQVASVDEIDRSGAFFVTDAWRRTPAGRWQVAARYSTRADAGPEASIDRLVTRQRSPRFSR